MTNEIDQIRRQANTVPVNIEAIIRGLGVGVQKSAPLQAGISGQIKRLSDGSFEISSTGAEHYFRQRFTLAHELGHYVLHRSLIGAGVDDDTKYRSTSDGDFYNTSIDLVHERQANSFAANLLMPENLVRQEIAKRAEVNTVRLEDLYKAFQVSRSAMDWRLKNLGVRHQVED